MAEAVAELVDNALDARLPEGPVRVEVTFNSRDGWIRVADDGQGMTRAELADALVLGLSQKRDAKIGKFGLGMKTACTSLGSRFDIWTATPGGTYAQLVEYDEEEFLTAGEWRLPIVRRKKNRPHGTSITVQSERLYGSLHQSLVRNLGWTFRHFLTDGLLELRVNNLEVPAATYEVDEASIMPFEGVVAGKSVRGWAGLLLKSSQRGWYGFGLVRHRRIIRRHEKLGFQAHPSTARVVGELHLDDFDTNNLKTDFIRETGAWRELEAWISSRIEPVLAQSRALAHGGMLDLKIKARIEAERQHVLGASGLDGALNLPGAALTGKNTGGSRPVALAVGALHLEHVFRDDGASSPYVSVVRQSRPREADLIVVQTNLAHPAAHQVSDRSGWACHNLAEVAARELAPGQEFVALKGILLAKLLDERPLRRALVESGRDFLREPQAETVVDVDSAQRGSLEIRSVRSR